jgi:hypothetical protein
VLGCCSNQLSSHKKSINDPSPRHQTTPPSPHAVVVVLSEAFISKKHPMQELHLLLDWRTKGSPALLYPVLHGIDHEALDKKAREYKADPKKQRWAEDLRAISSITGTRPEQVITAASFCVNDEHREGEPLLPVPGCFRQQ